MPRKKKEETTEEVTATTSSKKVTKKQATTTKCSKYGFAELQNNAKLHVNGLHGKLR